MSSALLCRKQCQSLLFCIFDLRNGQRVMGAHPMLKLSLGSGNIFVEFYLQKLMYFILHFVFSCVLDSEVP